MAELKRSCHIDVLRSANHIAAKKNIFLVREVSGSDCVVYGDNGRIRLQNHRGILEIPSGKQYNVKTKEIEHDKSRPHLSV